MGTYKVTSFDALINAQVICPTAELIVDSGYREWLKIFSRVKQWKYDTILNINLSFHDFF